MSIFSDTLGNLIQENSIVCPSDTVEKCETYFKLMVDANRTTNLTRITDEVDAAQMHFFGAMELTKYIELPDGAKVIDVGTGAGFPGIPLKIIRQDIEITLIDSVGKKTDFIKTAAEKINLDVKVLNMRAEETVDLRGTFDIVLSRAVANLAVLTELCVPLLKTGGIMCAFKGGRYKEELSDAQGAIKKLYCTVSDVHPSGEGAIIILRKEKPTPSEFPRRFSKIKSNPL